MDGNYPFWRLILCGIFVNGSMSVGRAAEVNDDPAAPAMLSYRVIDTFLHDLEAFTQGLIIDNGVMYEGTGFRGRSSLRRVNLESGEITQVRDLPSHLFGEGITVFEDRIVQSTWTSTIGFVYDARSFELFNEFTYSAQGWGITNNGEHLIMSDGTATWYYLDPSTFKEVDQMAVRDNNGLVIWLNELEYVRGWIYANV